MKKKCLLILLCLTLSGCSKPPIIEETPEPILEIAEVLELEEMNEDETEAVNAISAGYYTPPLNCLFFERESFEESVLNAGAFDLDLDASKKLLSGVIPHHLLAGELIASFFKTAALNRELYDPVETIIFIAPMHEQTGLKLCSNLSDWSAPTGILPNEVDFSERFIFELNAEANDAIMESDHAISGLIPYAKRYFPEVSVSCLLISASSDINVYEDIANLLCAFSQEKSCLFVFSVDFSHYLRPELTEIRDAETRAEVLNMNIEQIKRMTDENMDSPRSICAFLTLTELLGGQVVELAHSNSLIISGAPYNYPDFAEGLTSYFVFAGTG